MATARPRTAMPHPRSRSWFVCCVTVISPLLGLLRFGLCFSILGELETYSFAGDCSTGDAAHLPGLLPLLRSVSVIVQIQPGVSLASTITSVIVAARREITPVWIISCFSLIAIGILNAAVLLGLHILIIADLSRYTQVTGKQAQNADSNCDVGFVLSGTDDVPDPVADRILIVCLLALYLVGGSIEVASLSGRHLVSSPWRLPTPFQPFIAKQRSKVTGQRLNVDVLETALVDFEDTGPLSRHFRHDESEWQRSPETPSQVCGNFALQTHAYHLKRRCAVHDAEVRRDTERSQSQLRRSSSAHPVREVSHDGPCFDPNDRYWAFIEFRNMKVVVLFKDLIRSLYVGVVVAAALEITQFVNVRKAGLPCQWYQSPFGFSFAPMLTG